ncbi:uncharacterized protein LOC6617999 [Drosophila sechellia]|uniref:GM13470 n=1 Tax=Drosophila sechellia TaxID=7238 RepID=B4IET9_DROSE|nr:uncharacterized protein LOC6617999 [Drosophila sechellia]XP_032581617.1 uncharacterized protein LOC6617999 [Drosophila sechellia]EDW46193.1 GM13470 [Drosophila sechellia]
MKHLMEDPSVLADLQVLPDKTGGVQDQQEAAKYPAENSVTDRDLPAAEGDLLSDKDTLGQLACSLYKLSKNDHIVIDRKRHQVIRTDAATQQITIYRCPDPAVMGIRPAVEKNDQNPPPKVGRPSKKACAVATAPVAKKPTLAEQKPPPDIHRTRSGRQVRSLMPQPAPVTSGSAVEPSSVRMLEMLVADLRDKDYKAPMAAPKSTSVSSSVSISQEPTTTTTTQRAVPKNAVCPGCGKIFLGRRLQRHFVKFPEHMPRPVEQTPPVAAAAATVPSTAPPSSTPSLFGLLTAQLQRHSHLSEEQRSDLFLNELNDFVEQLQLRSQRLIRNTSGLHFVNARIARVLGIPEGQYALDMSAMESPLAPMPESEGAALVAGSGSEGARNLVVYAELSMSLDDPLTDEAAQHLNLSAGGQLHPPSEESLLRNVSDLMQPPVATAPPTVNHGYDHASDNAVEALTMKETPNTEAILDLNVDFFQFNPN